ncbi:MAG: tyrosine--tRNA ligase [Thaumarchaeota archaeon]|nr:tyrosine--tRNA ligase [Nitrososphaerota archaeon]
MDTANKVELVLKEPIEEVVTKDELVNLFNTNSSPRHYIGLEISGLLHLGSLILTGYKINDFIKAGVNCTVFLADWHTYINDKLGGNWDIIAKAANYYADAFKFFCPGVNVVLGSDLYRKTNDYWANMIKFSKQITLTRTLRALTIMGRSEKDRLDFSQLLYPSLQATDIWALDLDIVHAGIDQRKVHMLVREVFPKLGWKVPVGVHHHLLSGLAEPVKMGLDDDSNMDAKISSKMSKSKPWTSVFIHDCEKSINEKMNKAFCPERVVENNPILELVRHIIFHEYKEFTVERSAKYGGSIAFGSYREVEEAFVNKKLHPQDLKQTVGKYLNEIIEPVRMHFKGKESTLEAIANI